MKICDRKGCSDLVLAKRSDAKYCSSRCSGAVYRDRRKSLELATRPTRICSLSECYVDITVKNLSTKYCSNKCASRDWVLRHRDYYRERAKAAYHRDPIPARARRKAHYTENKDYYKLYRRERYLEEREVVLLKKKLERDLNPEIFRERERAWYRANPEKSAAKAHKRRARKLNCPGSKNVTKRSLQRLLIINNYACAYGGSAFTKDNKVTWDHVIPLSRGGRDAEGNLVPSCLSCNSSKGNKLLADWRRIKGPDYRCPIK